MHRKLGVMILAGFLSGGCGGGGSDTTPTPPPTGNGGNSQDFSRYAASQPLTDNSGADSYMVLLMGNSHAAGLRPVLAELLALGQPLKTIDVQLSSSPGFLADRVNDGTSEQELEREAWTHVILQGQQYSTSGGGGYPTDAAEYWIRGSKLQGGTPILFPEHPRQGNTWEGGALWNLHTGIAQRENACVAPVGLAWDEVIFRLPALVLHDPDGNHAAETGLLLTALVFYPIITGEAVETLPALDTFGIDAATGQTMKDVVSSILFTNPACAFDP